MSDGKPAKWALPPRRVNEYHSKSAAYAEGFSEGWAAAADVIRERFFGGLTRDMILDWLGNPERLSPGSLPTEEA